MKLLFVMLFLTTPLYAEDEGHDCDYEGKAMRGERQLNQTCHQNIETFSCNPVVEGERAIDKALANCQCALDKSDFLKTHNQLVHFKYSGEKGNLDVPDGMDQRERWEYANDQIKALCTPFKAVQINTDENRKLYAIYEYREETEWYIDRGRERSRKVSRCHPVETVQNFPFSSKYNFPGSINRPPILQDLLALGLHTLNVAGQTNFRANLDQTLRLSLQTFRYNGPYNPSYLMPDNSKPGIISCNGSFSELIEVRQREIRIEERKLADEAAQQNADRDANPGSRSTAGSGNGANTGSGTTGAQE